ncbi:hypothetical protein SK128_024306 [Halocaridina rubra]|uniref:Uroporphyrinogen decarboxylase (URO-D) domain-containing protein n=1 Tax=Halocaridina rubra TaxID=373956 RepID=A0AAN8ZWL1_HALRR
MKCLNHIPKREIITVSNYTPENHILVLKSRWTIFAYMIEGKGSKTMSNAKAWLYKYPKDSHHLLEIITKATVNYLTAQVKAGAQVNTTTTLFIVYDILKL